MYKSHDYQCERCRHVEVGVLIERDREPLPQSCTVDNCDGVMIRLFGCPRPMRESLPDGNGRFNRLKIQSEIRKGVSEAKRRGDFITEKKLKKELGKT